MATHIFGGVVFGVMLAAVGLHLFPGAYAGQWGPALYGATAVGLSYGFYRGLGWAERVLVK